MGGVIAAEGYVLARSHCLNLREISDTQVQGMGYKWPFPLVSQLSEEFPPGSLGGRRAWVLQGAALHVPEVLANTRGIRLQAKANDGATIGLENQLGKVASHPFSVTGGLMCCPCCHSERQNPVAFGGGQRRFQFVPMLSGYCLAIQEIMLLILLVKISYRNIAITHTYQDSYRHGKPGKSWKFGKSSQKIL